MDERTQRELAELKELRRHLQLQRELPEKIKSNKKAWDKSIAQWESAMKQQAWKQALDEMPFKMSDRKPTHHAQIVTEEIQQKIHDEYDRKEKVHKTIMATVRVIAVIVSILIVVGVHWYLGLQVFDSNFDPEYMSLMKMIPNINSDDAFDPETFTMLAIGQFIAIAAINSILCFVLNLAGGEK